MKKAVMVLSLTVAFLVGCLTATVATSLVVPPAKAGTNSQRWEYYSVQFVGLPESKDLNKFGAEGWEVASMGFMGQSALTGAVVFKRPLP